MMYYADAVRYGRTDTTTHSYCCCLVMTNDTNTSLDTTELERRLQSNNGDEEEEELDDVENGDVTAEKGNGSKRATSTKPSQYVI